VEFVVPAGTGGGADQMARIIQWHHRQKQVDEEPMVVVNKRAERRGRFLDVKEAKGDPHKLIITLSTCSRPRLRPIRRSTGAT